MCLMNRASQRASRHRPLSRACIALRAVLATVAFLFGARALSHPVIFTGGTAVMGHHMDDMAEVEVVHSPTARTGLGLGVNRHSHATEALAKGTALLWRGNYPDFQANFYLGGGVGRQFARHHAGDKESPLMERISDHPLLYEWTVSADGEDRQIYTLAEYSETYDTKARYRQQGKLRLGFSPYKAQSNELAMWGILEWTPERTAPHSKWQHEVTPLVRMFYKSALVELGSSLNGTFVFNYMFHFF